MIESAVISLILSGGLSFGSCQGTYNISEGNLTIEKCTKGFVQMDMSQFRLYETTRRWSYKWNSGGYQVKIPGATF